MGRLVLDRFSGRIRKVHTPLVYRFAALWVAGMMVLLPVVYVGLIVLLGYGVYYHATANVSILKNFRPARFAAFAYLTPIVAGSIGVVFMIKPLFAPRSRPESRRTLVPGSEPLLFAFVQKVCECINAPSPGRIDVNCEVNASAHLARGILPNVINQLVLTIGLPLVTTMSIGQLAGVLAHEFGHFAQGAGMRLSYVIYTINLWFARVVYERDAWDEKLIELASDNHWLFALAFQFARLMVWLSRGILWVLMLVAHAISCFLERQQEYDADRRATRLIGSEAYAKLLAELPAIDMMSSVVMSDIGEAFHSHRLCDDFPSLIGLHMQNVPQDARDALRRAMDGSKTRLFDTHPAQRDRVTQVRRENTAGVFQCELPAYLLFRDFTRLSKARTLDFYREVLGGTVSKDRLVPLTRLTKH